MRVGCDLDNVLVDIILSAKRVLAADLDIPIAEIEDTGIYWQPFTHPDPVKAKLLQEQPRDFWDRTPVITGSRPLPAAREAAWRLHREGLLACYITRRPTEVAELTRRWILTHGFPPVSIEHVGIAGAEDYFERCKSSVCKRHGISHMIDDHPAEAESLFKAGIEVILIDAPVGREARSDFLAANPHFRLAPDISTAADMLIADFRKAA